MYMNFKLTLVKAYEYVLNNKLSGINRYCIFSIAAGVFVALFLIIYQPFGLYDWQYENKLVFIAGFGIITTIILLIAYSIENRFFDTATWSVSSIMLSSGIKTFLISFANVGYASILGIVQFSLSSLIWFVWVTFSIGLFPIVAALTIKIIKKSTDSTDTEKSTNQIKIISENGHDVFQFKENELLYITSVDNYCEIVSINPDDTLNKTLVRSTLKNLERQIKNNTVVRCHRSHLINLSNVNDFEGNSQGLKLSINNTCDVIPVSRKYARTIKEFLLKINNQYEYVN